MFGASRERPYRHRLVHKTRGLKQSGLSFRFDRHNHPAHDAMFQESSTIWRRQQKLQKLIVRGSSAQSLGTSPVRNRWPKATALRSSFPGSSGSAIRNTDQAMDKDSGEKSIRIYCSEYGNAWPSLEHGKQHFLFIDMVAKFTSVSWTGSGFSWVGRNPPTKFLLSTSHPPPAPPPFPR